MQTVLGAMDMPLPLLERLKRHFPRCSLNTSPLSQVTLDLIDNDATTNSSSSHSDAAKPSPGAAKHICGENTGSCSNSDSVCSHDINDADQNECASCRDPAGKDGNKRSRVSGSNSCRKLRNNTNDKNDDSFVNISDNGSCNHVNADGATELGSLGVVSEYGNLSCGNGSQSHRRKSTKKRAGLSNVAASCSSATASRIHGLGETQEVDTIAAADKSALSARCAWTSSRQSRGNITWVCQGVYAHEGFHCVYLLRSLRSPRCTYIGYSVNPLHRLRQHNGEVSQGGAWKTRRHRPWALVLVVYGFPHAVSALQFEWRWQRTIPVPPMGNSVAGRNQKKPAAAVDSPTTTGLGVASATSTRICDEAPSSSFLQPCGQKSSSNQDLQIVTGDLLTVAHIKSSVTEDFTEVTASSDTSPIKRSKARRSPAKPPLRTTASDLRIETSNLSTSDVATVGGKALLEFRTEGENKLHGAGLNRDFSKGEGKNMKSLRASLVDAKSCDNDVASIDDFAKLPYTSSSPYQSKTSIARKTYVEKYEPMCGLSKSKANVTLVDPKDAKQPSLYRLSRTGNGIVARVGLRLKTLVALLHTEPFKHMPLGVHVVDAYTAAPYFRLLVRERKMSDPQQQQRCDDVKSRCGIRSRNSRAQTTRRSAWMLLQRSLTVSFGDPALLLPLVNRFHKKGHKKRKMEDSTSSTGVTDTPADAGKLGREAISDSARPSSGSFDGCISGGDSESDCAAKIVEDSVWGRQRAESGVNTTTAHSDGVFAVEDFETLAGRIVPVVNDFVPCPSREPRCKLCGCEFLREPRQRPASRCGKCLCFYHLTCLARSVFGKSPRPLVRKESKTGLDECNVVICGSEASSTGQESSGSGRTWGSQNVDDSFPVNRRTGLVPAEVTCACCGFIRSWAEVLADGVVLSADTVQETFSPFPEVNREEIRDECIST